MLKRVLEAVGDRLLKYDTWRGTWYNRLLAHNVYMLIAYILVRNEMVAWAFIIIAVMSGTDAYVCYLKSGESNERWYMLPLLQTVVMAGACFLLENELLEPLHIMMAALIIVGLLPLFWQE